MRSVLKTIGIMILGVVLYRCWEVNNRPGSDPATERVRATLDRMREARLERERLAGERAEAARRSAEERAEEEAEAAREGEADRRERDEAGAREARLRAAAGLVRAEGLAIVEAVDVPGADLVAFLGHRPGHPEHPESYLVERGVLTIKDGPHYFEWVTLPPRELAEAWAERTFRGEGGPWRAEVTARTEIPSASFSAVITSQSTGKRYRIGLPHFWPSGGVELALEALDP